MVELPEMNTTHIECIKKIVAASFADQTETLKQLVRIPGIAWDAFDAAELERSANKVAQLFEETGIFDFVEIRRSSVEGKAGAPAVVAKRAARNNKPQVLLYAHHDVQPPADRAAWNSEPFEPVERDGRLFGRGAADDKAGIVAHFGSIGALKELLGNDFDLGITMFIEGEEEAGSPTFANFLKENAHDLAADLIIVADSGNWTTEIPALTSSLRGLVSQVIELRTLDHAVHSGMFGGAVPDSMTAMIRLLASLHDENGDVAVSGLVTQPVQDLPYSDQQLRQDSGLLEGVQTMGTGSILQRIWAKPAITVIGIDNPSVALSSNTLQPSTRACISMRIAPGQDPDLALQSLREHLKAKTPFGARLEFGEIELGQAYLVDSTGWGASLMKQCLEAAYSNAAVEMGIGGSIPFIAQLKEVYPQAQILVTGVEDPDSRAHSPNESLHLETLLNTTVAQSLFLVTANQVTK